MKGFLPGLTLFMVLEDDGGEGGRKTEGARSVPSEAPHFFSDELRSGACLPSHFSATVYQP